MIGPVFMPDEVGGLELALSDVADQLRRRGWDVELAIFTSAPASRSRPAERVSGKPMSMPSMLRRFEGWELVRTWWRSMPRRWRRFVSGVAMPRSFLLNASESMRSLELHLSGEAGGTPYDVVLLCLDGAAPGSAAAASRLHPRVVFVSLSALSEELGALSWRVLRGFARCRLRRGVPADLYRRIPTRDVKRAIFASKAWMDDAVRAGMDGDKARTIYFGVPCRDVRERDYPRRGTRLLWVGRLSPEKGLHFFIRALREVRRAMPDVTLTAIAGGGGIPYRQSVLTTIARLGLKDAIRVLPPCDRSSLQHAYAESDLLCFYSQFDEPVALTAMEAFEAGLPVVTRRPRVETGLLRPGETCACFDRSDRASIADVVVRTLQDAPLRSRLAANAARLIRDEFSLEHMGDEYDRTLREWLAS